MADQGIVVKEEFCYDCHVEFDAQNPPYEVNDTPGPTFGTKICSDCNIIQLLGPDEGSDDSGVEDCFNN